MDFPASGHNSETLEYRKHWWNVYKQLSGRTYTTSNEDFSFDVDHHVRNPYPFCTQDSNIVGSHLMAIGNVIRSLNLPPKSTVLEMGAGWGNLSLFLAQMGHNVTVLDINSRYGELIGARAKSLNSNVEFWNMEFEDAFLQGKVFDCVLFFESFHHSYDHVSLLDHIPSLISPGGMLALAGEPINENLPFDWGLNPAGEALWQIHTHGWFELIFKESYLVSLLERKGFTTHKHVCADNANGTTLVCRYL
jgi:2-polyprenyl-3-methyl-5-hydroxy-6-metoxy-1,4-benzoquinol methylase